MPRTNNPTNNANAGQDVMAPNDDGENNADARTPSSNENIARLCIQFCRPVRNFVFLFYGIALVIILAVVITIIVVFTTKSNEMDNDIKKAMHNMDIEFKNFGEGSPGSITLGDVNERGSRLIQESSVEKLIQNDGSVSRSTSSYKNEDFSHKKYTIQGTESSVKSEFNVGSTGNCSSNPKVSGDRKIYVGEVVDILNEVEKVDKNFDPDKEADLIDEFKKFAGEYGRCYPTREEFLKRYMTFRKTFIDIQNHNATANTDPNKTYTKGINVFSDKYDSEIHGILNVSFADVPAYIRSYSEIDLDSDNDEIVGSKLTDIKESFDWRDEGVVSPVRTQKGCSSCWAIASASAIDASYNIKHKGANIVTSPQHLLDCVSNQFDCSTGGVIRKALEYAQQSRGVCVESDKPYLARKKTCDVSSCKQFITVKNYLGVRPNQLQKTLKRYGPIVTALAISKDFLQYKSGIFNGGCNKTINHAVVITGYGYDEEKSTRFWTLKNSWGENWGDNGYIHISRDTETSDGFCQINRIPFVVLV